MFFYLLPEKAILIDNNPELINVYEVIRDNVQELILSLQNHRNESDYFYSIRNIDRKPDFSQWNKVEKASRTIFLNRCCYNGLYRVNSQGGFNVPFGKYKNPKFCDAENLEAAHQAFQNIEIVLGSFELCVKYAKAGDFVYFDPPYVPLSKTANFTSYTKHNFGEADQQKLKEIIDTLTHKKVKTMLSNSDSEFIRDLYKEYSIQTVQATRAINSDASKRGAISEVVILNYTI